MSLKTDKSMRPIKATMHAIRPSDKSLVTVAAFTFGNTGFAFDNQGFEQSNPPIL